MYITKDRVILDPKFPFRIERHILKHSDNNAESFHYHDFCEITYVESGRGCYKVNGRILQMNAGDLVIFNNVEPHGWMVEDETMTVLVMTFATEFVSTPTDMLSVKYLKPFVERGGNFVNQVPGTDPNVAVIYGLMLEELDEYQRKEPGYECMIKADALKVLTLLLRHYQDDDTVIGGGRRLDDKIRSMYRLEQAMYYINTHFNEKIMLEEVASIVYMSPNYFSTYFHRVTGKTFSEYLTVLRLQKAEDMHHSTDLSISDIALECGFRNLSNFYRLLKKYGFTESFKNVCNSEETMVNF